MGDGRELGTFVTVETKGTQAQEPAVTGGREGAQRMAREAREPATSALPPRV